MEPGLDTETRFEAALLVAGSIEEGFLFLVDIFTLSILKLYIYRGTQFKMFPQPHHQHSLKLSVGIS
jgi:hypothetical protein